MENYKNESLVDVAHSVLSSQKDKIAFKSLFDKVCELAEISDEEKLEIVSNFFSNLSLDGRFVALKNNEWDLRSRQTYDKVHVDLNDVYDDIEGNSDEEGEADEDEDDEEESILHSGYGSDDSDMPGDGEDY